MFSVIIINRFIMWSKLLTVINTLLIFTVAGAGLFIYQENAVNLQRFESELSNISAEIENLASFQNELSENPILNLGLEKGDSLRLTADGLVGFVDLEAYLTYEEKLIPTLEDPLQVAVLRVKNPTDLAFVEYVNQQIELESEYFSNEGGLLSLPLGCPVNNKIEGSNLIVEEEVLAGLEGEEENLVRTRLFFSSGTVFVDACESGISGIQILN